MEWVGRSQNIDKNSSVSPEKQWEMLAQVLGTLRSFQWRCQYVFKAGHTIELEKAKMPI